MSYLKLLWAVVGAVALTVQTGIAGDGWTTAEKIAVVAAALGVFGVWLIPNTEVLRTAKAWVNGLLAGLAILVVALDGGVDGAEWATVIIAVLTTAGVAGLPGAPLHRTAGVVVPPSSQSPLTER
jgi:hypothetical protein